MLDWMVWEGCTNSAAASRSDGKIVIGERRGWADGESPVITKVARYRSRVLSWGRGWRVCYYRATCRIARVYYHYK